MAEEYHIPLFLPSCLVLLSVLETITSEEEFLK